MLISLLNKIETWGNKIPHPSLLFIYLCLAIVALSFICNVLNISSIHPTTQSIVEAKSLASPEGIRFMLTKMVKNFMNFAPLGVVLVAMLGIGIAEKSGLMNQLLMSFVNHAKNWGLTFFVAFIGVMSSLAADSGYVILIPMAALLFQASGRAPLAGIATAFAAVSGGYSANLLVGPIDAVLSGLSTSAVNIVDEQYEVTATANWYFNIVSTFLIASIITLITERKTWRKDLPLPSQQEHQEFNSNNNLKSVGLFTIVFLIGLILLTYPENAILRDPETGSLSKSPFISSIVVLVAIYFAIAGLVYGKSNNTFNNSNDVIIALEETMKTLSSYLVLMFFASQFIAWFNWSNLGLIFAINSAEWLSSLQIEDKILLIAFVFISALINLFIGSASAQWALMAPVFIPMFYLAGIQPEVVQVAYRIGDSSTNIITPMMPYFALVVAFAQRYIPGIGIGTLIATMIPYSVALISLWSLFLLLWLSAGIPLGI